MPRYKSRLGGKSRSKKKKTPQIEEKEETIVDVSPSDSAVKLIEIDLGLYTESIETDPTNLITLLDMCPNETKLFNYITVYAKQSIGDKHTFFPMFGVALTQRDVLYSPFNDIVKHAKNITHLTNGIKDELIDYPNGGGLFQAVLKALTNAILYTLQQNITKKGLNMAIFVAEAFDNLGKYTDLPTNMAKQISLLDKV